LSRGISLPNPFFFSVCDVDMRDEDYKAIAFTQHLLIPLQTKLNPGYDLSFSHPVPTRISVFPLLCQLSLWLSPTCDENQFVPIVTFLLPRQILCTYIGGPNEAHVSSRQNRKQVVTYLATFPSLSLPFLIYLFLCYVHVGEVGAVKQEKKRKAQGRYAAGPATLSPSACM